MKFPPCTIENKNEEIMRREAFVFLSECKLIRLNLKIISSKNTPYVVALIIYFFNSLLAKEFRGKLFVSGKAVLMTIILTIQKTAINMSFSHCISTND
ncbi:hypothetical protein BH758_00645 [Enterococcus hirae]|nr:hypothetical protein BH758_00645 [Enterococcus hirae]OQO61654.1 hypothetical protein BH740_00185 [Enterococcus hirae]